MPHLSKVMTAPSPLISRPFRLHRLGTEPVETRIEASPDERAAIARAFELPALGTLVGRFRLLQRRGDRVELRLDLEARATRICVVSLDAFEQPIRERASLVLVPGNGDASTEEEGEILDPDSPDEIPIAADVVDLGVLLTEQLALALDPYPHRPGAEPPATGLDAQAQEGATRAPFAALAALKRATGSEDDE